MARDPAFYSARKFARRHRAGVAISAAIAAVLIAATTFSVAQMREAQRQRDAALLARQRADAQVEFGSMLMSQLGDKPMTVREILDRARVGLDRQFTTDSGFITSALLQLSGMYSDLDEHKARKSLLDRAEAISVASHDTTSLIQVRCNLADYLRTEAKHAQAESMVLSAISMLKRTPDPAVEADCMYYLATLENEMSRPEKSAPAIRRAIAIRDSVGQTHDVLYVSLLDVLGYTLDLQNRPREAIVVANHGIALLDTIGRGQTTSSAILRHNLGVTYNRLGETAIAESVLFDVLGRLRESDPSGRIPEQPLIHYAHAALYQGDLDSARRYFSMLNEQGLANKNKYWQGRALFGLAQAELQSGRVADAKRTIESFRQMTSRPTPSVRDLKNSDDQIVDINTLDALTALAAGDTAKGNTLIQKTLTDYGYYKGRRSRILHSTLMIAARAQLALGHADSALAMTGAALKTATRDSLSATRSARVGEAELLQARAELLKGDTATARTDAQRAVVALRTGGGVNNPRTKEAEALVARLR